MIQITENEILDALRAAVRTAKPDDRGAMRIEDICRATGWGTKFTHRQVREQIAAGMIEVVRIDHQSIDGRVVRVPAYRFKGKPRKRAA